MLFDGIEIPESAFFRIHKAGEKKGWRKVVRLRFDDEEVPFTAQDMELVQAMVDTIMTENKMLRDRLQIGEDELVKPRVRVKAVSSRIHPVTPAPVIVAKRKRGRPRLTEEEKARRALARRLAKEADEEVNQFMAELDAIVVPHQFSGARL